MARAWRDDRGEPARRGSLLNDPEGPQHRSIRSLLCAVVVFLVYGAVDNAVDNLRARAHRLRLRLLERHAGFDISQTLIPYSTLSTYGHAFWVGLLNTLLVAALGIVLATILGFIVGIARLSTNWLVAQARDRSMSRSSATSRCCCNCCSGTTPC